MNREATKRNVIAVLVAFIVVFVIYLLVPPYHAKPEGILLPTALPQFPIPPEAVIFYSTLTVLYGYQILGHVNVQFYSKGPSSKEEVCLQEYVRKMAARVGANGVIVTLFGHTMPRVVKDAMSSYVFHGVAIRLGTGYLEGTS